MPRSRCVDAVCDMRVERELEERRKKAKVVCIKTTLDTTIATVLEKRGKDAPKWTVDELCAVVKHLKRPGYQKIPLLRVDLLAQFEMTRH